MVHWAFTLVDLNTKCNLLYCKIIIYYYYLIIDIILYFDIFKNSQIVNL